MTPSLVNGLMLLIGCGACVATVPSLRERRSMPLAIVAAIGLAIGLPTLWTYVAGAVSGTIPPIVFRLEAGLSMLAAIAGVAVVWGRGRASAVSNGSVSSSPLPHGVPWTLRVLLAVAVLGTVWAAVDSLDSYAEEYPEGWWDAWMIWNLRARSLFRLPGDWSPAFTGDFMTHPDYPLLVPLAIVRQWTLLGEQPGAETPLVGQWLATAYTLLTAAALCAAVIRVRGWSQGCVAACILLATPAFVEAGSHQCADVPLAFHMLVTLALVTPRSDAEEHGDWGRFLVAGLFAGLAGWTKNEGLAFVLWVVVFRFGVLPFLDAAWRARWRTVIAFGAGLVAVLVFVLAFKFLHAPPNDLVAEASLPRLLRELAVGDRHTVVLDGLWRGIVYVAGPLTVGLVVYGVLVGFASGAATRRRAWLPLAVASSMLVTEYLILVTTPHNVGWHVGSASLRLIVQLWPMVLLAVFTMLADPEETAVAPRGLLGRWLGRRDDDWNE